ASIRVSGLVVTGARNGFVERLPRPLEIGEPRFVEKMLIQRARDAVDPERELGPWASHADAKPGANSDL
ncbi:MAG: hypothetical protein J0J15_24145, partial [Mesorhizobium sp.]|nr:hypothetical protein [Mesorhizobium sp.]